MAYIIIPPTVAKARDENKLQKARLQQWECDLGKYLKLCPHLNGPIGQLRDLLKELREQILSQESLIQQRIQLQTALVYPELHRQQNATDSVIGDIPLSIAIPDIDNKTPPFKTRLQIKPRTRDIKFSSNILDDYFDYAHYEQRNLLLTRPNSCTTKTNNSNKFYIPDSFENNTSTRLPACQVRKRPPPTSQDSIEWKPIPPKLQAYPSVLEQLTKLQHPVPTPKEWQNRFAPLFLSFFDNPQHMESVDPQLTCTQASNANSPPEEAIMEENNSTIPSLQQPSQATASKISLDMLRDLIPVSRLDPALINDSPASYASAVRVVPQGFEKVRLEVNIGRFPKDTGRTDRILSLFEVAKLYDKHVCLCPSGPEPNPVLYTQYDIKRSRIYRYFQDKPGAQKGKYANNLFGYIVFGVTGDVDDFVMAMKEWATSNRHELARHGVPSTSVVAGFIVHASLTLNRDDMVAAIHNTSEWHDAGNPEFSIKISPLWSSGGAEAKVPAMCCECERSKVVAFEKMCEDLFFGENLSLPSAIRGAYFFPSRKFAANDPSRLAYIGGQRDFLTTERTVTCGGLGNVYQEVRLKRDPKYSSSVEDILLLLQGTKGPLFRSMDRTTDDKVFLKIDESNIGAWMVQKDQLGDHLRTLIHPDDHTKVFTFDSQELTFSEPWMKYKDGQLTKNITQLPCKASLEYVNRYKAKFMAAEQQLLPTVKKRIHSTVTSIASSTTATTDTSQSTATPTSNLQGQPTNRMNVVDLTANCGDSVSSPSHKVHVVEQRAFQDTTSPVSSMAGSLASDPRLLSPKTARMCQLESKVAAHDQKLQDIQTSVSSLDAKIVSQGEQSSFQFGRFKEMLSHIHGTIVQGMQHIAAPRVEQPQTATMDEMQDATEAEEAYDPIRSSREWNEEWQRYQLSKSRVDSQRAECAERLCKDAEAKGECYDYYAAACERFPSPPPVDFPDDITYVDEL